MSPSTPTNRVLSRLFFFGGGVLYPPIVQIYPPFSVSEVAAPPIIKNDGMQSRSLFNNYYQTLYTCKYTALVCSTIASNSQNVMVPAYRVTDYVPTRVMTFEFVYFPMIPTFSALVEGPNL